MKLRSWRYQTRQGFRNIGRNKLFSMASIATMTACIFIFGAFLAVILNVDSLRESLEQRVGITVYFEEGTTNAQMEAVGQQIKALPHVATIKFTSADEAWEAYKKEYFASVPELAEGFQDNPLANSASFTITVDRVENQEETAAAIKAMDRVRRINQSSAAVKNLKSFNKVFIGACIAIVLILLLVAAVLISNTVNIGIAVRREEIAISKLIGATDSFVRAPFIVEGIILGLIGSAIPLLILFLLYNMLVRWLLNQFGFLVSMGNIVLSAEYVFQYLLPAGLLLGVGIGFIGAAVTVKRHLHV
ncbi:MAG: permease-like cell division protein FtsX [Lachnospiraceae bacterium]|nr:permease-like cell division protein FtsX [Lachnospiraceae bacterium]